MYFANSADLAAVLFNILIANICFKIQNFTLCSSAVAGIDCFKF